MIEVEIRGFRLSLGTGLHDRQLMTNMTNLFSWLWIWRSWLKCSYDFRGPWIIDIWNWGSKYECFKKTPKHFVDLAHGSASNFHGLNNSYKL